MDVNGRFDREFVRTTVSAMDPHTTGKKARGCNDCHQSSKVLGLGEGQLLGDVGMMSGQVWKFMPANRGVITGEGELVIGSFNTIDGRQLVHTSRPWLRTFNKMEINRILNAGRCTGCHDRYDDPVIINWQRDNMPSVCPSFSQIDKN
jgi:hypothetical protein